MKKCVALATLIVLALGFAPTAAQDGEQDPFNFDNPSHGFRAQLPETANWRYVPVDEFDSYFKDPGPELTAVLRRFDSDTPDLARSQAQFTLIVYAWELDAKYEDMPDLSSGKSVVKKLIAQEKEDYREILRRGEKPAHKRKYRGIGKAYQAYFTGVKESEEGEQISEFRMLVYFKGESRYFRIYITGQGGVERTPAMQELQWVLDRLRTYEVEDD